MKNGYSRVSDAIRKLATNPTQDDNISIIGLGPLYSPRNPLLTLINGQPHILLELSDDRARFNPPVGNALAAEWRSLTTNSGTSQTYLDLHCPDRELHPTFHSLVGEMLERMDESGRDAMDEFLAVLKSWRETLEKARKAMGSQRESGLFGELHILRRLAKIDPLTALSSWRGSRGYPLDFVKNNALEVKTYRSFGSPSIKISGTSQLDPPAGGNLHLVAFHIDESANGESIADIVDDLVQLGLSQAELHDRIRQDESPKDNLSRRQFRIVETRLYHVGDDFPGIRASRMDSQSLLGVSNVSYSLNLDSCPGLLEADKLDKILQLL